jgi:Kef-type K+ transport system membrane component KefB
MSPIATLILQLIIILLASQIFGWLVRYIGQPKVIGEIFAGILLGPSFLGQWFPETFDSVFTENSIPLLSLVSQIGLIFFMFTVGLHANHSASAWINKTSVLISTAGIIFPFALGLLIAPFLYDQFAVSGTSYVSFACFFATACSITAFPVLAKIISDKKLENNYAARMALNCAAIDDIAAWIILAAVVGMSKQQNPWLFIHALLLSVAGIVVMLKIVSPLLKKLIERRNFSDSSRFAIAALVLLLSSLYFEFAGVHALFGAFLAGITMPKILDYREFLASRIETIVKVIFLPAFFAITGLQTEITLIQSAELVGVCLLIIALCIIGKLGGVMLVSKFSGLSWRDSTFIGLLMNTRGLMELVVLNVGLELNIISQSLFTIMVIMAIVTTCMTGPLISLLKPSNHNN